jgi:hypothetical protein
MSKISHRCTNILSQKLQLVRFLALVIASRVKIVQTKNNIYQLLAKFLSDKCLNTHGSDGLQSFKGGGYL